jgi:hypothetical protein
MSPSCSPLCDVICNADPSGSSLVWTSFVAIFLERVLSGSKFFGEVLPLSLAAGLMCVIAGCSPKPAADPVAVTNLESATPASPSPANTSVSGSIKSSVSSSPPRLTVDGDGLRWFLQPSGAARPIPFGSPQAQGMALLEARQGDATEGTNQNCGAGPVQFATWQDGLSLVFKDKRFVGWGLNSRAAGTIATAGGIGPGSTRAELEAVYRATVSKTSLGQEFSAGDLHGVLDGSSSKARITDMWGGVSCVAR